MMIYEINQLALDASPNKLLDIDSYISTVEYKIDPLMFDQFWQSISKNLTMQVDGEIFEWLGYYSKKEYNNKANFIKLLVSHKINYREVSHTDDDFYKFSKFVEEAKLLQPQSLHKQKWLVLDFKDFKRVIMCLQTKRGDAIRDYYINLEELFFMYVDYSRVFMEHQHEADLKAKEHVIQKQDQTIDNKSEVVVPDTLNPELEEYFVLVRMSEDYIHVEGDSRNYLNSDYVCIRAQWRNLSRALRKIRDLGNGTNVNAKEVIRFKNPNPVNYRLRLKDNAHVNCNRNSIKTDLGEESLIQIIQEVNDDKYSYGVVTSI